MSPTFRTIVISCGLTNDAVNPHEKFIRTPVNVGRMEIERLMGQGENLWHGVLPEFLAAVGRARQQNAPIHHILVRDLHDPRDPAQQTEFVRYGDHNLAGTPGAAFIPPVERLQNISRVIDTPTLSMPIQSFHPVMSRILGRDLFELTPSEKQALCFIITGVYTQIMVLNIALGLRHEYQFTNVCVCPHLVGGKPCEAHLKALGTDLPNALITVVSDLAEIYRIAGLPCPAFESTAHGACRITPHGVAADLSADARRILEVLFLFHSQVDLTPLSGGFSGSLLFMARANQMDREMAPQVVKIDTHLKIQKELSGYEQVKAVLGKHIPTMATPVSRGALTGLRMELAAMAGSPQTLQFIFENITDEAGLDICLRHFRAILTTLVQQLYRNTGKSEKIYPYRIFGLHTQRQQAWLVENLGHILPTANLNAPRIEVGNNLSIANPVHSLRRLARHADRVPALLALCHGDLNYANILLDQNANWWIIDWFHAGSGPVETDFAKLENDLKFVLSKRLESLDLRDLARLEGFLLQTRLPPERRFLPEEFQFVNQSIHFQALYDGVRAIREAFRAASDAWDTPLYWVALLRFALHTLSFEAARGRGECSSRQLKHVLISVSELSTLLSASDLHRYTRRDRPAEYPRRFDVPLSQIDWQVAVPDYHPPYYVAPEVLAQAPDKMPDGWADPETPPENAILPEFPSITGKLVFDPHQKPLNPLGRSGIAGRGLLGRWGPNPAVDPVVTRYNPYDGRLEILFTKRADTGEWMLPGTLMRNGEAPANAARRAVLQKAGIHLDFSVATLAAQMVVEDFRNTDHAWIESRALHLHLADPMDHPPPLSEGPGMIDAAWLAPAPELLNTLFANHARIIRRVLALMRETKGPGHDEAFIDDLLHTT